MKKYFLFLTLFALTLHSQITASEVAIPQELFDLYTKIEPTTPALFEVLADYEKSPDKKFSIEEQFELAGMPLLSAPICKDREAKTVLVSEKEYTNICGTLQFMLLIDKCVAKDPNIAALIEKKLAE